MWQSKAKQQKASRKISPAFFLEKSNFMAG
jgi:hypothetical protein